MKIKIFPRGSANWKRFESSDQYLEQFNKWHGINGTRCPLIPDERDSFICNIKLWDEICRIPYTKFRAIIKKMARANWDRVGCDIHEGGGNTPNDTVVIPCDDDDWLHPKTATIVKKIFEEHENIDIVQWDCWRYQYSEGPEIDTKIEMPEHPLGYNKGGQRYYECFFSTDTLGVKAGSNGYALRLNLPGELYADHRTVDEYDKTKVFYLRKPLSIWTGHHASFSYLAHHTLKIPYHFKKAPIPENLQWANEEIGKMRKLTRRLNPQWKPKNSISE